jgi:hypothetical protein
VAERFVAAVLVFGALWFLTTVGLFIVSSPREDMSDPYWLSVVAVWILTGLLFLALASKSWS